MRDIYISNLLGWTGHIFIDDPAVGEDRFWVMRSEDGCIEFRLAKCRGYVSRVLRPTLRDEKHGIETSGERRNAA